VSDGQPTQFLTVGFMPAINIGFIPQAANGPDGIDLTVAFQAKLGTSFYPYDLVGQTTVPLAPPNLPNPPTPPADVPEASNAGLIGLAGVGVVGGAVAIAAWRSRRMNAAAVAASAPVVARQAEEELPL
jgi:hypothetical protein